MIKLTKNEIRRRALRAAGKVALMSTLACGGEGLTEPLQSGIPDPIGSEPTIADPSIVANVDAELGDRGLDPVEEGVAPMLDGRRFETRLSTVAVTACAFVEGKGTWEDYVACCDAIGWDWNRGCAAWGPPVPPSLEVA